MSGISGVSSGGYSNPAYEYQSMVASQDSSLLGGVSAGSVGAPPSSDPMMEFSGITDVNQAAQTSQQLSNLPPAPNPSGAGQFVDIMAGQDAALLSGAGASTSTPTYSGITNLDQSAQTMNSPYETGSNVNMAL